MSDIKLFQINNNKVSELEGRSIALRLCKEKDLLEELTLHFIS
jgi:hypothetical protein